jgi:alpha-galactosidase
MEAIVSGVPYKFGGNVMNHGGLIENLPIDANVEVPCIADNYGIMPCYVGRLPVQLAAMNMTHVNVHLIAIEAARTLKKEHVYQAVMLDPLASAELSIDDIRSMVDDLIEAHGDWMPKFC